MTFDPAIVIAFIGGLLALFGLGARSFLSGAVLPRNAVPREDYDAQVSLVKSYAERFGEQTTAVKALTRAVEKLAGGR